MPETITNLTQGMPVEIGKIDRELKQLWQDEEGAATRASLINFAVFCEGAETMAQTTDIISQITRDHACRAILIGMDPNTTGAPVQAWILAHCHLSRAGAKAGVLRADHFSAREGWAAADPEYRFLPPGLRPAAGALVAGGIAGRNPRSNCGHGWTG